jgi:tetratricopeptide (TPR) repeat protein
LHNAVPLLFALGLSGILAYVAVAGLRLLYRREVRIQRHVLRTAGKWTAAGTLFAGALLPLGGYWGHAAWSRYSLRDLYADGLRLGAAGSTEPAIAALRRAVEIDPGYRDAQEKLASLLCDAGRMDEGIAAFRAAVARNPSRAETRALLALALYQTDKGNEARAELERAVALAPASPDLHRMLAEVCAGLGDAEAAKAQEAEAARLQAGPGR